MNKQQLIEAVTGQLGDDVPKRQVEEVLNTTLDTVAATLRRGDSVQLTGFGTFVARRRAGRKGVNPRTGQPLRIKASTVPAFKPGKNLKDVVAKRVAAKKATKKAATKKAAKKVAKKAAKKAAPKKTVAKKAAKKASPPKKTAAKKASPRKSSRKQAAKRSAKKTAR